MEDKKQRISLFLDKDFVVKMDKEIKSAGFKSRNDFVVYAVNSYFADKLLSDENSVVNEKLAKEIAKAGEEQQKRISKGLFRYAVEFELIMKILADEKHFPKERLEEMRRTLKRASEDANSGVINHSFVEKYIDKIYVTPIDETHMEMKIKLFTNETTTKYLENLRVRTGHTFKVVETTTQPLKPDYSEAYKAYKTVLKQNAFEIKDYDFQNETNKSKQIVFADILGDDTPELIFTKATIDSRDESRKNASLNIYSYANGKCEKISFEDDYSSDLKDEYILQTDDIQMYTPYIIYQKKNDKSLYMFQQKKSTAIVYKLYKFMPSTTDDTSLYLKTLMDQTYSTMPNVESSGTINGKEVGYDKCDKYKYNNLNKIDNLLLYSDKQDKEYGDYYSPEKCKDMTYSVAMKYLDKYDSNNVDCSGLEGSYIRVTNSYGDDTIEITEDGAFRSKDVWSQGEPCNESVGHGLITDLTKVNDYKYTFNCSDIVLDNEPGTYGKKYVNEKEVSVEYIDNLFNTDNKLVFYPKGTPVLCMDKADYKIYKATPASTSITEQSVLPQKTIILRGEKDNHVFIEWDIN